MSSTASTTTSPGRLLVVDDNEMNRDMLSRRLIKQGHEVAMAVQGRHALELLRASSFDLVLLDIMMPEMDGYEVLAEMKRDPALRNIPIVMISALGEIESVVKCIEMGAEDYLPKPFNPVILRARVNACLEKKRLRDKERLWAESLEREMEVGRRIQKSFLPEELPAAPGWQIAACFEPARQVAGDFYDAFHLPGGRVALVIADVCDKGVGAALFMALFRSLLRAVAGLEGAGSESAGEILSRTVVLTNDYIAETHSRSNMFATVFFAILDSTTGDLSYINGGHEPPLVVRQDGSRSRLTPTGPALGLLPGIPFRVAEERLLAGDTLFAYTDGVTDAKGPAGFYSEERLIAEISGHEASASELLAGIDSRLKEHVAGGESYDDITMLAVRRES